MMPRAAQHYVKPQERMGRLKGMYTAECPIGTHVRVWDRASLDAFVREWRFHHPLDALLNPDAYRRAFAHRRGTGWLVSL